MILYFVVMEKSKDSFLFPLRHCKTLHLLRHGQGTHNIADVKELDEFHFDAHLTPQGWQQVDDLRRHVRSSGLLKKVDLVIVSPLLRTLQTAVGVFGGDSYTDGIPLMAENVGSSDHPAISCLNCPPFLALEKCREIISAYPCDKRRSVSEYRKLFPAIDFSMIENNDDILWDGVKIETNEELASRGVDFLNWLWSRKEKEIAIVTHSGLLTHTLEKVANCYPPVIKDEIVTNFENCELRSMTLIDKCVFGYDSSSTNYPGTGTIDSQVTN